MVVRTILTLSDVLFKLVLLLGWSCVLHLVSVQDNWISTSFTFQVSVKIEVALIVPHHDVYFRMVQVLTFMSTLLEWWGLSLSGSQSFMSSRVCLCGQSSPDLVCFSHKCEWFTEWILRPHWFMQLIIKYLVTRLYWAEFLHCSLLVQLQYCTVSDSVSWTWNNRFSGIREVKSLIRWGVGA